jgi:hypothetical protein
VRIDSDGEEIKGDARAHADNVENNSIIRLCARCATAFDKAVPKGKPRRSKKPKKPPAHSIASGRDYGLLSRIGLERPNAAEQLALADVRTYGVVAKIHVPEQPTTKATREEGLDACVLPCGKASRQRALRSSAYHGGLEAD